MKKNSLFVLALGSLLLVSSCKKDDPEPENNNTGGGTTDIIAEASTQAHNDVVSFTQNEGAEVVNSLADVLGENPEPINATRMAYNEEHSRAGELCRNKAKAFRQIFVPGSSSRFRMASAEDDAFNFNDNVGTYTFNRADSSWSHNTTVTDKIILLFPSDTTSSVNDAKLTIFAYSEVRQIYNPGTLDADTTYQPTSIDAELTIGAVKYVDVIFTAAYNSEGIPTSMSYTLYLKPFTQTLSYTDNGSSVSLSTTLAKDGEATNIVSSTGTITFYDSNKDSVLTIAGTTTYRRLKFTGSINLAEILEDDQNNGSTSIAVWNSSVDITIIDNSNSQTVGTLEFFDNAGTVDAQVKFTDNSTKLASDYFDPIFNEMEDYLTALE